MTKLLASRLLRFGTPQSCRGSSTGKFRLPSAACLIFAFCIAAAIASPAQTFTTLVSFDGTNGAYPSAGLAQGPNGNFYGTTLGTVAVGTVCSNGEPACGTVFEITPAGALSTLYAFCPEGNCSGGGEPLGLTLAASGNFYGITFTGGSSAYPGAGTIFEITPAGQLTTIYDFCSQTGCGDGLNPVGTLVQASDGNLYGTTEQGGTNPDCPYEPGCGTVFKITPKGELTTLHNFSGTDGYEPESGLVQAANGNFYGTTAYGGGPGCALGCGTVFEITPTGKLTTVYKFCSQARCADGAWPFAGLIQANNGDLYGTTLEGGANADCSDTLGTCGTVFEVTPTGKLTTIYSFCNPQVDCSDGELPEFGLLQAADGNLYGTTQYGVGSSAYGTIFEITPGGGLNPLYDFCTDPQGFCPDGENGGPLVQGTDGAFYGTTEVGGTYGVGVVFSLSVGLKPFVETTPPSGKVGAKVIILGNNLKGATRVAFNGADATITSDSDTEITTTVPTGATTGEVEVMTAAGKKLESNVFFQVIP